MTKRNGARRSEVKTTGFPNGLLVVLMVAVVTSAIGVIYSRAEARHLFQELGRLKERHDAMTVEWDRLLLEESTFAADYLIEKRARESLGMVMPDMNYVQLLKP